MSFVDPYYDNTINTLRNLLGATSQEQLDELEAQIVYANQIELESLGLPRTNDLTELQLIHKQLFKGVFDWAGKIRTVDIRKNQSNSDFFLIVSRIYDAAVYVFGELAQANGLKNLELEEFVEKLAYFYDQLNYIHPFREGNGRTQRVFWDRVAKDAGYLIHWDLIDDSENDEACRVAAEGMDLSKLIAMFTKIVKTA